MLDMHDDLDGFGWRKPARSMNNGNCVEIGAAAGAVLVRDSKDKSGAVLRYQADSWLRFVRAVASGRFDSTLP